MYAEKFVYEELFMQGKFLYSENNKNVQAKTLK